MMDYFQETDSKIVFKLPTGTTTIPFILINQTTGGSVVSSFIDLSSGSSIEVPALRIINQSENPDIIKKATFVLNTFRDLINDFYLLKFEFGEIPPFRAFPTDNEAIIVEWTFKNFRIGFNFDNNIKNSGWYLITTQELGGITAYGYLPSEDKIDKLILWLINFAFFQT